MAIQSFKCNHTQILFEGEQPKRFKNIETVAERKLQMLDSAVELKDLRAPPANRLEALKGNREGQYSIRINDQWRVCFRWVNASVADVEIVDYH
jgi:toxin HigB-1